MNVFLASFELAPCLAFAFSTEFQGEISTMHPCLQTAACFAKARTYNCSVEFQLSETGIVNVNSSKQIVGTSLYAGTQLTVFCCLLFTLWTLVISSPSKTWTF
jgi:hypothetical protein